MRKNKTVFRSRNNAEDAVCRAFAELGILAGVNVGIGTGPADLDDDLIDACHQSYFNDPHFLGGPCSFGYAKSLDQVDELFAPAFEVSGRLLKYIMARGDPVKTKAAESALTVITNANIWMQKIAAR